MEGMRVMVVVTMGGRKVEMVPIGTPTVISRTMASLVTKNSFLLVRMVAEVLVM
jgi:hypothetical protein